MKKYFTLISGSIQKKLAFPANLTLWLLVDIAQIAILPFIWVAIIHEKGNINGFAPADIITYYVILTFIAFATSSHSAKYVEQDIVTGNLNKFLTKPLIYCIRNYVSGLGYSIIAGTIALCTIIVLYFFFPNVILLPFSRAHLALFIISLFIASFLSTCIQQITGFVSFWMGDTSGVRHLRYMTEKVFSGEFAPLTLYPIFMQTVASVLPFKYLFFIPISLYLGKISVQEGIYEIIKGIIWLGIFLCILLIMWKQGVKRYDGSGA